MKKFSKTEQAIKNLFLHADEFTYQGVVYTVLKCGKPAPPKGECKTDVYVLTKNEAGDSKEFKISIKQSNADFLENKIALERAFEILGADAQSIIEKSVASIKDAFERDYLVYFNAYKSTKPLCLKMGWKFEFINKHGGDKCGEMCLTDQQKIDIFAGINLNATKKNSLIDGVVVADSGIANYMLVVDDSNRNLDYYLSTMRPIEQFACEQKIFFVCKALNYRVAVGKWDSDRPLAVYVDWFFDEHEKLQGRLVFDKPLSVKGNTIGVQIKELLAKLCIGKDNFGQLQVHLHGDVRRV